MFETARLMKGVARSTAAELLGVDSETLRGIEKGRISPRLDLLDMISRYYEKPVSYFLTPPKNEVWLRSPGVELRGMNIRLKKARINSLKTVKEIVTESHVAIQTIYRYEKGEFFPTAEKLEKLARVYGASFGELLGVKLGHTGR